MAPKKAAVPKWQNSRAKELLEKDLQQGRIPIEGRRGDAKEMMASRAEYGGSNSVERKKFATRLRSTRKSVRGAMARAQAVSEALEHDRALFPEKETNHHDEPRWDIASQTIELLLTSTSSFLLPSLLDVAIAYETANGVMRWVCRKYLRIEK